jgi:solute carrier family 35 protein E1
MSKVAVSFTHIIKSAEPAFSVIVQRLLFGQSYPSSVYLSLLPIIGGCGLAAATELNFNMTGELNGFFEKIIAPPLTVLIGDSEVQSGVKREQ